MIDGAHAIGHGQGRTPAAERVGTDRHLHRETQDDGHGQGRGDDAAQRGGRSERGLRGVRDQTPDGLEIHGRESALAQVGGHPVQGVFDDQSAIRSHVYVRTP